MHLAPLLHTRDPRGERPSRAEDRRHGVSARKVVRPMNRLAVAVRFLQCLALVVMAIVASVRPSSTARVVPLLFETQLTAAGVDGDTDPRRAWAAEPTDDSTGETANLAKACEISDGEDDNDDDDDDGDGAPCDSRRLAAVEMVPAMSTPTERGWRATPLSSSRFVWSPGLARAPPAI